MYAEYEDDDYVDDGSSHAYRAHITALMIVTMRMMITMEMSTEYGVGYDVSPKTLRKYDVDSLSRSTEVSRRTTKRTRGDLKVEEREMSSGAWWR